MSSGRLDPLPQLKPYEPFAYNAFDLPDPFKPRKIQPGRETASWRRISTGAGNRWKPIRLSRSRWWVRWHEASRCLRW